MTRAKVTDEGVVVPRQFFETAEEVEISKENGAVVLRPVTPEDPIRDLGKNPICCGVPDASERHDPYLTDGP